MSPSSIPTNQSTKVAISCAHCGLPVAISEASLETNGRYFCCTGCRGAYAVIHEMGLEDYYALRADSSRDFVQPQTDRLAALEHPEAAGVAIEKLPGGLDCARLSVDGMHCAACSWLIERMQPTIQGLHSARVRLSDNSVELIFDPNITNLSRVATRISVLGYTLSPWEEDREFNEEVIQSQRQHWYRIALAAFLAANSMWIGISLYAGEATGMSPENEKFLRWLGAGLGLLSAIFPGRVFLETAWQAIKTRTPHVDIPVAISIIMGSAGALYGAWSGLGHVYFDSLTSFILLLLLGRYLQFRSQASARKSVAKLMRWNSPVARKVLDRGECMSIPAHRLQVGDVARVLPGEAIPADGNILSGDTQIDTSLLTGEPLPINAGVGAVVVGGTVNLTSTIDMVVSATGSESRIGQLMSLLRNATSQKTRWIQAADRVGKWFVLAVLALAVGTWCCWAWIDSAFLATQHTIALLTIACPCALALAAPLVITIAIGRGARHQIWIREGNAFERLSKPGTIWLDKTGTLTLGKMFIHDWHGDWAAVPLAAAIENQIAHPIAAAIVRFAKTIDAFHNTESVVRVQQTTGHGAVGWVADQRVLVGNLDWMLHNGLKLSDEIDEESNRILTRGLTPIYVAIDQKIAGVFSLGDVIRPDTIETLKGIQSLGWQLGILSGDHARTVASIRNYLEKNGIRIADAVGELSPEDKWKRIQQSQESSVHTVVMIGDGVNDAAALASADVGIAIRGGGEQSLASAPVYISNNRISSILELLQASRQVVAGIRRCFVASLIYNSITIGLAICGWIHPLVAALFMPLSGITVLTMAFTIPAFISKKNVRP